MQTHPPSLSQCIPPRHSSLVSLSPPCRLSHAGSCISSQWLTASMWSLWCSELDFLTHGSSAAFPVIWQDTESQLAYVKGGLSGCNICARACARMSADCRCEVLVEQPGRPVFSTLTQTHTRDHTHQITANTHSRLIWPPGGGGWWVGPNRIFPASIYRPYSVSAWI